MTVRVAGWPFDVLQQRLWEEHRIITNVIREFDALRFSLAFFTSEQEVEITLEAVASAVHRASVLDASVEGTVVGRIDCLRVLR